MIGYDVEEETRTFEKEGFTGEVKRYSESNLQYPCLIIEPPIPAFKLDVLQSLMNGEKDISEDACLTHLYMDINGTLLDNGIMSQTQVRAILDLFDGNKIVGFVDSNTKVEGDLIYAFI